MLFYNEVNCMNILVIGCDQVGASLIRDLERICLLYTSDAADNSLV